jgi:hypothetical protein
MLVNIAKDCSHYSVFSLLGNAEIARISHFQEHIVVTYTCRVFNFTSECFISVYFDSRLIYCSIPTCKIPWTHYLHQQGWLKGGEGQADIRPMICESLQTGTEPSRVHLASLTLNYPDVQLRN